MQPTFKQYLEAVNVQPIDAFKGSLTNNEKRVLALLSTNQLKSAPTRARELMAGDKNMVQAVRGLKQNFKAVDVTPDGVMINQTGIDLAIKQGIVDPNSGEITEVGQKLATTTSNGTQNPNTQDLAAPSQQGMGQQSTPTQAQPAQQGAPVPSV